MFKSYKEVLKNIRDTQDQLWKSYVDSFPKTAFPAHLDDWQRSTLHSMNVWAESAIRQALDLQQDWLEQWSGRAAGKKIKRSSFADLSEQAQDSMQRWLHNQSLLWEQWVQLVKNSARPGSLPNLEDWEKTMRSTFQQQMSLLEDWTRMADFEKLSGKEMSKLYRQIEKSMQKFIEVQDLLWKGWFQAPGLPPAAGAAVEETPAAPAPPAKARLGKARAPVKSPRAKPVSAVGDDLKQISGIGPGLEKKLNAYGISTLQQIADLTDQDIASLEENVIRFSGRIKRDRWVDQARKLMSAE